MRALVALTSAAALLAACAHSNSRHASRSSLRELPTALSTPSTRAMRFSHTAHDGRRSWVSEPMSFAPAAQAWRELSRTPGVVAILIEGDHALSLEESHHAVLPVASVALDRLKQRRALRDRRIDEALRSTKVSASEVRHYRARMDAWRSDLGVAVIDDDDAREAKPFTEQDRAPMDLEEKPVPVRLQIIEGEASAVLALTGASSPTAPDGAEVAHLFADWGARYDARLFMWNGFHWRLDVARPPSELGELRRFVDEFALACPTSRSARGDLELEATPGFAMALLRADHWDCYWFVE